MGEGGNGPALIALEILFRLGLRDALVKIHMVSENPSFHSP